MREGTIRPRIYPADLTRQNGKWWLILNEKLR